MHEKCYVCKKTVKLSTICDSTGKINKMLKFKLVKI